MTHSVRGVVSPGEKVISNSVTCVFMRYLRFGAHVDVRDRRSEGRCDLAAVERGRCSNQEWLPVVFLDHTRSRGAKPTLVRVQNLSYDFEPEDTIDAKARGQDRGTQHMWHPISHKQLMWVERLPSPLTTAYLHISASLAQARPNKGGVLVACTTFVASTPRTSYFYLLPKWHRRRTNALATNIVQTPLLPTNMAQPGAQYHWK